MEKAKEILKKALLLEKKGRNFYYQIAKSSTNKAVQEFFDYMAQEESMHISELTKQYLSLEKQGKFASLELSDDSLNDVSEEVLSENLKKEISAASFEGAAISAAISFERDAVKLYSERAEMSEDAEEKKLYSSLAKWEQSHLERLIKLDNYLTEESWYDNSFWPT